MSDNFTSSSSSRRKAPALDPEDFASWEMMFQAHVGFEEWELFGQEEPQVDEDKLLAPKPQNPNLKAKIFESKVITND